MNQVVYSSMTYMVCSNMTLDRWDKFIYKWNLHGQPDNWPLERLKTNKRHQVKWLSLICLCQCKLLKHVKTPMSIIICSFIKYRGCRRNILKFITHYGFETCVILYVKICVNCASTEKGSALLEKVKCLCEISIPRFHKAEILPMLIEILKQMEQQEKAVTVS